MKSHLLKHALQQPFILSTGVFAIVHSTWTIGTFFSGKMPATAFTGAFVLWIVPAFLFSFSIDIGQIATAAEIRNGERTLAKYATFILLALTTFYLQFLYMAHHMPALEVSDGVAISQSQVTWLRNMAIWILPSLMPLSTIFYTLGGKSTPPPPEPAKPAEQEQIADLPQEQQPSEAPAYHVDCPDCDFAGDYDSERKATNALNAHKKHCVPTLALSSNGRH